MIVSDISNELALIQHIWPDLSGLQKVSLSIDKRSYDSAESPFNGIKLGPACRRFLSQNNHIEELHFYDIPLFGGLCIDELASLRFPTLNTLTISRYVAQDEQSQLVLDFIRAHKQLRTVNILGLFQFLPANVVEQRIYLPCLKSLSLPPELLQIMGQTDSVTSLKIWGWNNQKEQNEDLIEIIQAGQYPNLKFLELRNRGWKESHSEQERRDHSIFYETISSFDCLEDLSVLYCLENMVKTAPKFSWVCGYTYSITTNCSFYSDTRMK